MIIFYLVVIELNVLSLFSFLKHMISYLYIFYGFQDVFMLCFAIDSKDSYENIRLKVRWCNLQLEYISLKYSPIAMIRSA